MNDYLLLAVYFLATVVSSVFINGLVLNFAKTLGIRQAQLEGMVRWASTSKPSLGGISFYIVFLLCIAVYSLSGRESVVFDAKSLGLLLAATLGFLIGLADDAYNTKPILKFTGQFVCAVLLVVTGFTIHAFNVEWLNYLITIIWITGFMNSINMLDNMDGISSIASIAALIGMLIYINLGNDMVPTFYIFVIVGLIGALFGFLFYNWHPSKMYMGDTGSQFLGAVIGGLAILFVWDVRDHTSHEFFQLRQFVFPMLVFIVPLCDTATVSIRRIARGQSPFVGGKDHVTHQLAFLGLRDDVVVIVLSCVALVSLGLGYLFVAHTFEWGFPFTLTLLLYGVVVFFTLQVFYNKGRKRYLAQEALAKLNDKK